MERPSITAESREVGKKGNNRRLRVAGQVPAVLYGHGEPGRGLAINAKEIGLKMRSLGSNALYDLKVAGQNDPVVVMVKDFQVNAISRKLTHIDLLKIDLTEKVLVKVAVRLTGKAIGQAKGGIVDQARREIVVRCLPTTIPQFIEVDITNLEMGHAIHVNDLKLPNGVEAPQDTNETIVSIVAVKEEKAAEVAAPEAAAAAAPAAGAAAPAKAGAAAPKAGDKAEKK